MRLVGIETLVPGQKLAGPVYTTSGKTVLNTGATLTESYIKKLIQLKITKAYIEDERFKDVEISNSLDFKVLNKIANTLRRAYDDVQSDRITDEYQIKDAADSIVQFVRNNKDKGVSILYTNAIDDYFVEHSINVAILSAFMGNRMDLNYIQLCDLVTGSLIHDIGRDNLIQESTEHTQKGFDAMRKCKGFSLHSSIVCYEHHENFDGSGYPRKLKGTAISLFSRVVRTADLYDMILQGNGTEGTPTMPNQAYEQLLAASGRIIDPEILGVFRDTIAFFPNGSMVSLSNGLKGVVIRQNTGSPQRPVVRVFNEQSIIGEINLLNSLTISIKDVLMA